MSESTADGKLQEMIARLEAAGYSVVMVAPGYSRAELIADLRAVLQALSDEHQEDENDAADPSKP